MIGLPVPVIIIFAPSWEWVVGANVLLGVNHSRIAWALPGRSVWSRR